ncbi:hypothetical protein LCGC14_2318380 [marine sediment metagenome]|uniref:AAA+ ATPase domain-containing protein n=1 Tax=marine sediment metagenome TaxID=412755 RepID=A0A0F9D619_9ZZZZ
MTAISETDFELNIEALSERSKFVKILVYGESGVGKTVFASTAPRPILWLESEGGTNSIADPKGIDIVRVDNLNTYREALLFLKSKKGAKYKTVVLDSFTETQATVLKEIMKFAQTKDPTRDEFAPQLQDYQRMTGMMREIVRGFRDLDMHVIITALSREDKDELTAKVRVAPRLSPAIASEIPGFMDAMIMAYTATDDNGELEEGEQPEIHRNFLLVPTGKYAAKVRAPEGSEVPTVLRNAKFEDIAKIVLGS